MERIVYLWKFLSPLKTSLEKGGYSTVFFSIAFWIWVIGVTFWIETVSVQTIPPNISEEKNSQIVFAKLRFNQTNREGSEVTLTAPSARFDSESEQMIIDRPVLQWRNTANGNIVSASSDKGVFQSQLTSSSLPGGFHYLVLSGTASVQSKNSRVESALMLFDNEKRLFLFPGRFTFYTINKKLTRFDSQGMMYDPLKDKPSPIADVLKNDPEIQSLLQTIGTSKP